MPRKSRRYLHSFAVVGIATLTAAGAALAGDLKGGAKLHLKGPKGTLKHDQAYRLTASGKAGKATTLFAFQGGYVAGPKTGQAIKCLSSEKAEDNKYGPTYLGATSVKGSFSKSWSFSALYKGHKAFCAYLGNSSASKIYAHKGLQWTNK